MPGSLRRHVICVCFILAAIPHLYPQSKLAAASSPPPEVPFPAKETLTFSIEWRLIYAGYARLSLEPKKLPDKPGWESKLHIESGGLVSKLYKLDDNYNLQMAEQFCAVATDLNAIEGKRHRETKVTYDHARGKATYTERDLLKNAISKTAEVEIPACVTDIIGAIYKLRTVKLDPGQSTQLPISDGKKTASVRIDAQEREQIKTKAGTYNTIRYEAYPFNGVLFTRKAELQAWITDDARRLPVQIRARMSFPIGSITFELDKEEH